MSKLILTRHGQSIWNAENRFTGWVDVDLSEKGKEEAKKSGELISELNIKIDISYTSCLKRAIETLIIILKSLNLKSRGIKIISCPSCARQGFNVIETVKILEEKLSHIKTTITLSIIGCVVNGPGEAASTDFGVTGGGNNNHMLYIDGNQMKKISTQEMIKKVISLIEKKELEIKSKSQNK